MSNPTPQRRSTRPLGLLGGAVLTAAVLALGTAAGAAGPSGFPGGGASGSVAAVSGTTMQVQNAESGQTAVSWTSSTKFTETVTLTTSALAVGDCVTVSGSPVKNSKTSLTARTITVAKPASGGKCGSFGSGTRPTTGRPNFPGGFTHRSGSGGFKPPSGFKRPSSFSFTIATGKVTAISGSHVTVSGYLLSSSTFRSTSKSKSKSKKPPTPKTEKLTAVTSSSTTVTETETTTASSVAVGDCVTAFGKSATNGSVTAETVSITSTGGKTCTSGFGGFGGGGFGGGGFGGPGGGGGA